MLVDTQGFPIDLLITPAHVSDKEGLKLLYEGLKKRPSVIFADEGYTSRDLAMQYGQEGTRLEIVKKDKNSEDSKNDKRGFAIGPKRWIVERTFAWLGKFRRMSKDYELLLTSSKALILIALGRLILGRFSYES
jgi:putative transposase